MRARYEISLSLLACWKKKHFEKNRFAIYGQLEVAIDRKRCESLARAPFPHLFKYKYSSESVECPTKGKRDSPEVV